MDPKKFINFNNLKTFKLLIDSLLGNKLSTLTPGTGISIDSSGNISCTLDSTLYKVVTELPTTDINTNKIYLVLDTNSKKGNTYIEYMYVNNDWEELGKYKANIDLTPYITSENAANTYLPKGNYMNNSWYEGD